MKSHASINRMYRLFWSAAFNSCVAVAENARGRGKGGTSPARAPLNAVSLAVAGLALAMACLAPQVRAADAANATVSAGAASVTTAGNTTTTIHQTSQRVAIDWTRLSTRANEALVFNQPGASAIAQLAAIEYSPDDAVRVVGWNGAVVFQGVTLRVCTALHRLPIAFRADPRADGFYDAFFCHHHFMRLDMKTLIASN
jgi:hypothetical protein